MVTIGRWRGRDCEWEVSRSAVSCRERQGCRCRRADWVGWSKGGPEVQIQFCQIGMQRGCRCTSRSRCFPSGLDSEIPHHPHILVFQDVAVVEVQTRMFGEVDLHVHRLFR